MGLRELLTRQPKSFPVDAAPSLVAFAEQRMLELMPDELKQAFADVRHQMGSAADKGGLADGDKGMLQAAFLMGNMLKITEFVDGLKGPDKKLLDCLSTDRQMDPEMAKTLRRCGVSARQQHHQAAILSLLQKHAANVEVSLAAESISRL